MERECHHIQQLVQEFVDQRLSAEQQERIEKHLEKCAECKAFFSENLRLVQLLGELPRESLPEDVRERIVQRGKERLRAGAVAPKSFLFRPPVRWVMEVAAVFVLILIGWQVFYPHYLFPPPQPTVDRELGRLRIQAELTEEPIMGQPVERVPPAGEVRAGDFFGGIAVHKGAAMNRLEIKALPTGGVPLFAGRAGEKTETEGIEAPPKAPSSERGRVKETEAVDHIATTAPKEEAFLSYAYEPKKAVQPETADPAVESLGAFIAQNCIEVVMPVEQIGKQPPKWRGVIQVTNEQRAPLVEFLESNFLIEPPEQVRQELPEDFKDKLMLELLIEREEPK